MKDDNIKAKLLSFGFTKLNVERNVGEKLAEEIKSDIRIIEVDRAKIDLVKQEALKVNFEFEINYGKFGKVLIFGFFIIGFNPKVIKEILKLWKDKKLPADVKTMLLNIILQRSSLKALELEEEIGLPLHMQMPRIRIEPASTK